MKLSNRKMMIPKSLIDVKSFWELSNLELNDLLSTLKSTPQGLSLDEVEKRQKEVGLNRFELSEHHTLLNSILESILNPFNIILLIIAAVTYITDVVMLDEPDYTTALIILFMVFLSSSVSFIQTRKSDKAASALKQMVANKTHVYRDGKLTEIEMTKVVPGDIVKLSAGDMLPADVRFIQTKDTFISQSTLTGESQPVERFSDWMPTNHVGLTDLENIGLLGCDVLSGSALAVVLFTGSKTYISSIAKSISGIDQQTSFERGVNSISKMLVSMMLVMVPVVFIINTVTKGDWFTSLLFAISIAVGLTPEMLPVIMTSTLARGAQQMMQHKVIVRDLGAIQTFGEMDILCTDKTGTLTEDKIILEKYMNITGQDDYRVLRHAYLNSSFQTGLKNLIDVAIINRAQNNNFNYILDNYKRVDEVPFDFSRRRMSVVLQDKTGKRQLITKGAVEEMLAISSFVEIDGQVVPMGEKQREIANQTYLLHNNDGLRMIAVAQKNEVPDESTFSVEDEKDMVLIGFIGFLDPPKESAKEAIEVLKQHGVKTIVLTGDSEGVALKVCQKIGMDVHVHYTGMDVEKMNDHELSQAVEMSNLFSKLSPLQKSRVVLSLQKNGHVVGYMGDGINDAPALKASDVGISVDSAVDIAKETANIILLEKDLMVLEEGVVEGRKTIGNVMKYLKMAVSGNFGNMVSVIVASLFLPFLPMLPVHILLQNILNDFAQMGISFDNVDSEYVSKPKEWDIKSIKSFMWFLGPISSIIDILCFLALWFIMGYNTIELAPHFQAGWFVFGTVSQILVITVTRTGRIPFFRSKPAPILIALSIIVSLVTLLIGYTSLAMGVDLLPLSIKFFPILILLLLIYGVSVEIVKSIYKKKRGEWI